MFGPGVCEPLAATLMTSVAIEPAIVVTDVDTAPVRVAVGAAFVGAVAVALKYATSPSVVFAGINAWTPPPTPVLFVVRVIEDAPLANLPS